MPIPSVLCQYLYCMIVTALHCNPAMDEKIAAEESPSGGLETCEDRSTRPLSRCCSLNDGYDPCTTERTPTRLATVEEERFLVTLDDHDTANPRNSSRMRKWLIVITGSMGSLCV